MKRFCLLLFTALCIAAVFSGCSNESTVEVKTMPPADTEKTDTSQTENQEPDKTEPIITEPAEFGEFSMENEKIGDLALGQDEQQVKELLGQPEVATEPEYWGADDLMHKTWEYQQLGMVIGFVENGTVFTIESISVQQPFEGATSRGIRIGSNQADVIAAYGDDINNEESEPDNSIVVGSIYGGIIFYIENDTVTGMFLGAAAE